MKMKFLILAVAACVSAFAALQYDVVDFDTNQNWNPAHQIELRIVADGSLWMSNYVSNWYGGTPDLGTVIDMTANHYGVIDNDGNLVGSNGLSEIHTFTDPMDSSRTASTEAYFVGDFKSGDTVRFWITTLDSEGGYVGKSIGAVHDENNDTPLVSRLDYQYDMAGNLRFNFGFDGVGGKEFVFFGDEVYGAHTTGQPLPGVLATLAVIGGFAALKRRR